MSNGTVVSTAVSVASDWDNIVSIAGDDPFIIGLKSDGTVVTKKPESQKLLREYDGQCEVTDWNDIVAITMGNNNSAGLKSDVTIVITKHTKKDEYIHSYWNVKDWNNIVYITSGGSQLIGLKSDGTVVATMTITDFTALYDWGLSEILEWKNIRLPTK